MSQIGIPVLPVTLTPYNLEVFERERLALRGNEFESTVFASLERLPDKTTWIEISGLRIERIPRYGFFRFGNSLRSLDLHECSIASIEKDGFAGLHKLQRLSLTGNHLRSVGADWFRDLVGLQQLVLQRNQIEQVERAAFWHLSDSLRHLDLRANRLRCLAVEQLAQFKHLERVDITANPWTCTCRRNLERFLTAKNVGFEIAGHCYETANETASLDFSTEPRVEERPATGRVHWLSFEQSIRDLNVTVRRPTGGSRPPPPAVSHVGTADPRLSKGNCHPERELDRIYTCSGINELEELSLVPDTAHTIRMILSNLGQIHQAAFARFDGHLSRLELRDCGIAKIADRAFSGLRNLEYLSLRSNQLESISSESVRGLANLRHLDLSRNRIYRITNDVFDALPYLTSLDISENSMNCIGVEHMAHRLRYLRTLDVARNPWSCLCGSKLASYLQERGIRYNRTALVDRNEECYSTSLGAIGATTAITTPLPPSSTAAPSESEQTARGNCVRVIDDLRGGPRYRCAGGNLLLVETIPEDAIAIEFEEGHLQHLPAAVFSRFGNLKELTLRNCGLRSAEENAFAGLATLENLTIRDNPLESIGSSWFPLERLERLDLRGNSIRYIAPGAFQHLPRLLYLNLEGNDLRCIFTSDLNDMPDVHVVEFSGNPLKWRCRVELEQFLETRKIKFVKVESSCEGKKLVRNLLLQNQTDLASLDCSSDCSAAVSLPTHTSLIPLATLLPFCLIRFHL